MSTATNNFKSIAVALGLAESAGEPEILAKVTKMTEDQNKMSAAALAFAKSKSIVTAENESMYAELSASNPASTFALLLNSPSVGAPTPTVAPAPSPAIPPKQESIAAALANLSAPSNGANSTSPIPEDRKAWTYRDFEKKDPKFLVKLEKEHPETYTAMFNAEYRSK